MNERNRFDKFTERSRKVLSLAQEEAQRLQHNYIGTEHLLLGLVREGQGVAAKVLSNLGVELEQVRTTIIGIIGRGDRIILGEIGLTPRAKKVIQLAVDEARHLNHRYIGTEHLLLGLVREGEGIAAGVLESLGVNLEKVRTQTVQVLNQVSPSESPKYSSSASLAFASQTSSAQGETGEVSTGYDEQFDIFTVQAQRVLSLAQEEVQRYQHHYIGTEHLLLAITREKTGIAAQVLSNLQVELNQVRSAIESSIVPGEQIEFVGAQFITPYIVFTPRALQVLQLATSEARRLNHYYTGIEHLLLGLIREGEGVAASVLQGLGVTLDVARVQTLLVLAERFSVEDVPIVAWKPDEQEDIPTVVPEEDENEA